MIVLSVSGGKDSTALLCYALRNNIEFRAVYQDTGFEHPVVDSYLDYLEKTLSVTIERLKSPRYAGFIDMVRGQKSIPTARARFCTRILKQDPLKHFLDAHTDTVSEVWMGIRAEESPARRKRYGEFTGVETFPISDFADYPKRLKHIKVRLPIVNLSIDEVWQLHKDFSLNRNPLYDSGDLRVGCYPCVLATDSAWLRCWKNPAGKEHILAMQKAEAFVNDVRDPRESGVPYTFRYNQTITQFIAYAKKIEDQQLLVPDEEEEIECSWCHS